MENAYMKTTAMAKVLGYSPDFLLNNRGIIFFEGEHYFTQDRRINWKIIAMKNWRLIFLVGAVISSSHAFLL